MTLDVATQEIGDVMTSSPGPIPATCKAIFIVAVPLAKQRTVAPPKYPPKALSNSNTLGPEVIQPERRTSATAEIVASSMVGFVKGMNGWVIRLLSQSW